MTQTELADLADFSEHLHNEAMKVFGKDLENAQGAKGRYEEQIAALECKLAKRNEQIKLLESSIKTAIALHKMVKEVAGVK